jgi:hypothetical protein
MRPTLRLIGLGAILTGCAPALLDPRGLALIQGTPVPPPTSVRAVRAGCHATLKRSGKTFRFDVWIESDSTSGRLEALGPFNTPLATVLWTDTSWKTWLPGQGILLRGTGSSLSLPVLDLREIQPSRLVAPLLSRSTYLPGRVRSLPPSHGEVVILPVSPEPRWSLLLNQKSGLPLRRQTLAQGRETEGIAYFNWKNRDGALVPGKIVRTTPDGQILELSLFQWERLDSIPSSHFRLLVPTGADTISITRQGNGRKVFNIHSAGADDSAQMMLPSFQDLGDAPEDSTGAPDDTIPDSSDEDAPVGVPPPSHGAGHPFRHF